MDRLWAALAEVEDPEMPVNLVDLGVIYGVAERDGVVDVDLTFTAMGCPASEFILDDAIVLVDAVDHSEVDEIHRHLGIVDLRQGGPQALGHASL